MKHAIMVIGSGEYDVLQKTINVLDDYDIDFFIHWDAKFELPKLVSIKSKIFYAPRIKVNWGTDTQIKAELILINEVLKHKDTYDYLHLISESDIPLMDANYFKEFFTKEAYIGFIPEIKNAEINRIKYFYPISNINIRTKPKIIFIIKLINKLLRINRLKKYPSVKIEKGVNWFSINNHLAQEVKNNQNLDMFMNSFLGDEIFMQTIFSRLKPTKTDEINEYDLAARYIDWERGTPYTFELKDLPELKSLINTKYAFSRKVKDAVVVKELFDV